MYLYSIRYYLRLRNSILLKLTFKQFIPKSQDINEHNEQIPFIGVC